MSVQYIMISLKAITSTFLMAALALFPLYFFPSGKPQISDFVFLIFCLMSTLFLIKNKSFKTNGFPKEWFLLVLVVVIVSTVWAIILQDFKIAFHLLFWVFNLLISYSIYSMLKFDYSYFIEFVFRGVVFSLLLSAVGMFLYSSGTIREAGFFNNPNQLAYYSLVALVIILLIRDFKIEGVYMSLSVISAVLGILLSASISAIVSLLLIAFAYFLKSLNPRSFIRSYFAFFIIVMSVFSFGGESLINNLSFRMERFGNKVEVVKDERNYNRIIDNLEYTVLGAGEGGYDRFADLDTHEIHSSYGNLLFAYGFMGLGLFFTLLYRVFKIIPNVYFLAVLGPLLYSTTHMGLRSSLFWILIVICLTFKYRVKDL